MKTFKMLFSVLIAFTVLCSCSNDEEYSPMVASSVLNSLYVSVSDKQGEPMNSAELLPMAAFPLLKRSQRKGQKWQSVIMKERKCLPLTLVCPT